MWTDKFSFLTGVVASPAFGFLCLSDDSVDARDLAFTSVVFWQQGQWGNSGQVKFTVVSTAICTYPSKQLIAVGPHGQAYLAGNGDLHQETISVKSSPTLRGEIRSVRAIGGKAYAVGMNRQVYRRDGNQLWTAIDEALRPADGELVGFEAIDGFSEDELYAVGWEGEIWRCSDEIWSRISSPTNLVLTDVCCAGDGKVYACGRMGLVIVGRNDEWQVLSEASIPDDIWSLAWFKGHLYASTYQGIYRLAQGKFELVEMGPDIPETTYRLSASDDALWSIGSKDVMLFDGATWTRID